MDSGINHIKSLLPHLDTDDVVHIVHILCDEIGTYSYEVGYLKIKYYFPLYRKIRNKTFKKIKRKFPNISLNDLNIIFDELALDFFNEYYSMGFYKV